MTRPTKHFAGPVGRRRQLIFKEGKEEMLAVATKLPMDLRSPASTWYLHAGVSPRRRLHGPPAALGLVVGSVVGLGLHLDPQLVGPRVRRQLPVEGRERRAGREEQRVRPTHTRPTAPPRPVSEVTS